MLDFRLARFQFYRFQFSQLSRFQPTRLQPFDLPAKISKFSKNEYQVTITIPRVDRIHSVLESFHFQNRLQNHF